MIVDELPTIDLTDVQDWARQVYGICFSETARGWVAHLHVPPGGPADPTSALGPFASAMQALAAAMQLFHERLIGRMAQAVNDRYAAMQRAGLTICREVERTETGEQELLGTWGYLWACGCNGSGYPSEVEAIEAALRSLSAGHRAPDVVLAA